MKHFLQKILSCMFVCITCAFGAIDSANAATFTVNTSATNSFQFQLSAQGTFTVDCGTGGTLGSDNSTARAMISGATINKTNNTTNYTFKCTYSGSSSRTIGFDGTAEGYNTSNTTAAISFSENALITSVSGNLSAIFPYISGNAQNGAQPRFYQTFYNCTNLSSIPGTLFENITYTTASTYMFYNTFRGCTGLTSLPSGLFSHITTGAQYMFYYTFAGCTGLESIPSDLFEHITTGAESMFYYTFNGCTGLTSIPSGLFSSLTTGAQSMFSFTFKDCTGLTSLPSGLFSSFTTGAQSMFYYTFYGCTGLTSIPSGLFSNFTTGANAMFNRTFSNCSNLTGYIPPTLFAGLIANNAATNVFNQTFAGTGMDPSCSSGTEYASTYKTVWGGKVSCTEGLFVSYSCGSHGTGNPSDSNVYAAGATVTTESGNVCTPSSGYAFSNWSCNSGVGNKAAGATFTMPSTYVVCTAQYVRAYTVTYSCSNGTGTPTDSNSPYIGGATVTALTQSACTTLPGDYFNYWYCDGVGSVSSGGTFTMPSANVTCMASWSFQLFNVYFAAGAHGSGNMPSYTSIRARELITLPSNGFTVNDGYTFSGWNCNNNIGDKAVGETFSMPAATVTCTAQYTAIDYTVSFAAGTYGSGSMSSQTNKHVGDRITLPSNEFTPSSGYFFNGWSCDNNVGSRPAGGNFPMPAANVTCTAQWTGNTVNLTWYGEDGETTLSGGASSCTYGGTISSLPTAPEKPGYHFTKWKVK